MPRNSRSPAELFKGFDATLRHYVWDRPRAYIHVLRHKFDNLAKTNFELGCEFASVGKWADAVFRFRIACYFEPGYVEAWYNLGCCYLQLAKFDKAEAAFRQAVSLKPDYTEARFMLSGVAPDALKTNLPQHMPLAMVRGFFDSITGDYDTLAAANGYQGPRLTAEACRPFLAATQGLHLIEFGCGTGMVAKPWRGLCREIIGVDCTHAMVTAAQTARAGDNPAFDRVLEADVNTIAPGTFMPGAADVVLCIDTAQFLGDLAPILKTAAASLKSGGLLALSIEPHASPRGYAVNPATSRFGHGVEYVKSSAVAAGLAVKRDGAVPLYATMNAHLFVFAKEAA